MNNKRATKRALLTSVTALVMCVVMLAGTTFAWFTDTASTGVNKIQAGNLDVALEMNTGTKENPKWENAEGKTLQFKTADGRTDNILWEPGCRYQLPELRVVNKGNLALKYMIKLTGIKGDAKLNKAITWTITDSADGSDSVVSPATDTTPAEYKLLNANDAHTLTIMGEMDKNAGNEYQGLSIDGISITVYATQMTAEFDSIDNLYDKDAAYKGSQEFTSGTHVLNKGGVALNPHDVAVLVSGAGTDVTITGGYYDGGKGGDNRCVQVDTGAKVTIKDGTFTVGGDANGLGNSVILCNGGTVVIEGGFFYTDYAYRNFYYVLNQQNGNPGTITVKGGTFVNYDPSKGDDNLGGNFVPDGYSVISETKANGDVWYTVVKGTGVTAGTQEGLNNAISSNTVATVKLTEDGTYNLTDGIAKSKDVTFIGTKDTVIDVCQNLDGESGVNAGMNYQDGATLVFKGVTILGQVSGNYGGIVRAATTFEDCTIKGKLTLYGDTTFINCTFENQNDYSIWTWGAKNVTFEGCTFMTGGKAINLYGGADHPGAPTTVLTVNNCIFNDSNNGATGKAAIEVGNDYGATYILTVNNVTVNGFAVNTEGEDTGSRIWANKKSMDATHLTVTIDGVKVH